MDNKASDLRYAVKFENYVKIKNIFFLSKKFLFWNQFFLSFLEKYFFMSPKNLIALVYFLAEADTKKHRYSSAKASVFANCRGKFRMLHSI